MKHTIELTDAQIWLITAGLTVITTPYGWNFVKSLAGVSEKDIDTRALTRDIGDLAEMLMKLKPPTDA